MGIGRRLDDGAAAAENLRRGQELCVDFEANDWLVLHGLWLRHA